MDKVERFYHRTPSLSLNCLFVFTIGFQFLFSLSKASLIAEFYAHIISYIPFLAFDFRASHFASFNIHLFHFMASVNLLVSHHLAFQVKTNPLFK